MTIITDPCPITGCCGAEGDCDTTGVCHDDHGGPGSPLTVAQEQTLRTLCERYHVTFDAADYTPQFDLPAGYVAGWVGGHQPDRVRRATIYVGVSAEGQASS